jgi:hypothetical protein
MKKPFFRLLQIIPASLLLVLSAVPCQVKAATCIDDAARKDERPSVVFEVYGDVLEMGEKPVLLAQSPVLSAEELGSLNFNVELNARFKEVRLVVTDAGNGIASDHADWVNAGFITSSEPSK